MDEAESTPDEMSDGEDGRQARLSGRRPLGGAPLVPSRNPKRVPSGSPSPQPAARRDGSCDPGRGPGKATGKVRAKAAEAASISEGASLPHLDES